MERRRIILNITTGTVHEVSQRTGQTLCGLIVGWHRNAKGKMTCPGCIVEARNEKRKAHRNHFINAPEVLNPFYEDVKYGSKGEVIPKDEEE